MRSEVGASDAAGEHGARRGWTKNVVIVLALLAAGFLAAWLRLRPHLEGSATYTDGTRTYDSLGDAALRHAVWEDPRPLPGGLNTPGFEGRPALSPDGRFLVFAAGRAGIDADLWIARLEDGAAVDLRALDELNTEHDELAPAFGAGGLWFASNRPGGAGGLDLYRAPFDEGEAGAPSRAQAELQSRADDTDPAPMPDGGLLFASNRDGRALGFELYRASPRPEGFEVEPLLALSSPADEREPALASDGRALFFATDREPRGHSRLYRSLLEHDAWLPPEPIAGLPEGARGPAPAADGFTLLFALADAQGGSDIWRARSIELLRRPGPPVGWLDAALLAALLLLALLAWLAKRWERLDVLYKCFLASLLAHAALLLWTRGVQASAEAAEVGPERTFEVRLARPSGKPARELERGGRLELASAARPAPTGPERREALAANSTDLAPAQASPTALALPERMQSLEPRAEPHAPPTPRAEAAPTALRGLGEKVERSGDAARELEVEPRALGPSLELAAGRRTPVQSAPERHALAGQPLPAPSGPRHAALAAQPAAAWALDPLPRGALQDAGPGPALRPAPIALRQTSAGEPEREATGLGGSPASDIEDPRILVASTPRPTPTRSTTKDAAGPARFSAARPETARPAPLPAPLDLPLPAQAVLELRPAEPVEPPRTPYALRFGSARLRALEEHGGSAETEAAVAAGLRYLAGVQRDEGHWGDVEDLHSKYGYVLVGKTGLCLLAFLGAGHVPGGEHGPGRGEHAEVARRAVDFLLDVQDPSSGHFGETSAYSHGIATYALAECLALTGEPRLRAPLVRAVAHIVASQHRRPGDRRRTGGWGYFYGDERVFDTWPRTSISVWQVMALASARLSGIEVEEGVLDAARSFLENAWDEDLGAFRYVHDPTRLRSSWPTLPASTPAALFALSLLGADPSDESFARARRYVLERRPTPLRAASDEDFVRRATGNLYFYYYGSLALFRQGGRDWQIWNEALKESLLPSQLEDGSWAPTSPYARYAGDDALDRSYTTALCVLSLEIYYRYFTPLLSAR